MIKTDNGYMREFRCIKCRKLLGLEYIYSGRLSIQCPRCGTLNNMDFQTGKDGLLKLIKKMKEGD